MSLTTFVKAICLLVLLTSCQPIPIQSGFEIYALQCEIQVPPGYSVHARQDGVLQAINTFDSPNAHPAFLYNAHESWEGWLFESEGELNLISEGVIGDWRYFRVELLILGYKGNANTWDVLTSDKEYFMFMTKYGAEFLEQFRVCDAG